MTSRRKTILLAEDDANDVLIVEWAFAKAGLSEKLMRVRDGQEAIDYLSGAGAYHDRQKYPRPQLFLLDLKMPRVNGFEVLAWRNTQEQWSDLPIVIMSSSQLEADVKRAMDLGAAAYVSKPGDFLYMVEVARELRDQWLGDGHAANPASRGLAMLAHGER